MMLLAPPLQLADMTALHPGEFFYGLSPNNWPMLGITAHDEHDRRRYAGVQILASGRDEVALWKEDVFRSSPKIVRLSGLVRIVPDLRSARWWPTSFSDRPMHGSLVYEDNRRLVCVDTGARPPDPTQVLVEIGTGELLSPSGNNMLLIPKWKIAPAGDPPPFDLTIEIDVS